MRHAVAPEGATMNRLAALGAVALAGSVLAVFAGVLARHALADARVLDAEDLRAAAREERRREREGRPHHHRPSRTRRLAGATGA